MDRSPNVIRSTVVMLIVALATLATLPLSANRASAIPDGLVSHGPILIDYWGDYRGTDNYLKLDEVGKSKLKKIFVATIPWNPFE